MSTTGKECEMEIIVDDEHLSLVREQVCAAVRALSAELGGPGTQARPPAAAE